MESIHSKASLKGINYVYLIGGEVGVVKTIEKQHGLWVGAKRVLVRKNTIVRIVVVVAIKWWCIQHHMD